MVESHAEMLGQTKQARTRGTHMLHQAFFYSSVQKYTGSI
jgi:hypothetical protein